jgi:tripartite-type tricarboxylate transporter receptor subunit TctC
MSQRRSVLRGAFALVFATICASVGAQSYPTKAIQLLVPYAPGGAGDVTARLVAQKMAEILGQPVIVDNRPGAGAIVAAATTAKAKPDGYTLLLTGSGTTLSVVLFKTLPYNLIQDFTHVSSLAFFDLSLIVSGQSNFNSVADVLAYAKANPGKLNVGTISVGSTQNLAAEMFKSMAGIDAVIVPYKSTAEIISALRSKDLHIAVEILPPILGQISGKVVKVLAVTSSKRFPGLPEVPTLSESGLPNFEATSWNGISAPANTPAPIIDRLAKAIEAAVASPDVQKKLQTMGVVGRSSSPEQMTQLINYDITKWKAVIEKAAIPRQ